MNIATKKPFPISMKRWLCANKISMAMENNLFAKKNSELILILILSMVSSSETTRDVLQFNLFALWKPANTEII